jgi:two-component system, OmpR family, response regulator
MGQPKHILIVDDDGDVRDVIIEVLRNYGYRVGSAADGASMRDFIETGDPVDCVILDAFMPGEASISLAAYPKNRNIPVVVISGSPDAIAYAEENDLQLLKKPFRSQELYSAVAGALASGEFGQRSLDQQ